MRLLNMDRIFRAFGSIRLALLLTLVFFSGVAFPQSSANDSNLKLTAQAAILMEMRTGKILWTRKADLPLPPASTAKILTALVVLENSRPNELVTIPIAATLSQGATTQLLGGERLSVRDLLYALLVHSGNDAALALASHISGSVTKFAALMNQHARRLGALQSRFLSPTGLPQKGQFTTARDLAVITRTAMKNPEFRQIVATKSHPWKSAKWQGELKNSNKLLGTYDGAIGVKTGNTQEAGFCLVAAAERGPEGYIAIVLRSQEAAVWQDAKTLLDYAFNSFASVSLLDRGATVITSVVDGTKVPLAAAAGAHLVVSSDTMDLPQMQITLDELEAPIAKGEKLGEAVFHNGDREIARVDLVAQIAVPERLRLIWILAVMGALILSLIFMRLRGQRRRNRYIFLGRGNRLKLR